MEGAVIVFEPRGLSPGAAPPFKVEVETGEMVILTGPPGTGKSSILRNLAGFPSFAEGDTRIGGENLAALSHRLRRTRVRALRLAYVPQNPSLMSNLSVIDNLLLPARYFEEIPEAEAWQQAFTLLNAAGLGWAAERLPAALTNEDRRTAAVIRALLRRPRVALLDDPLAGLDAASMAGVRPLLRATLRQGECAILATAVSLTAYRGMAFREVPLPEDWLGDGEKRSRSGH